MEGFKMNTVAARVKGDKPGLYGRVMRYVKGEEEALSLKEVKQFRLSLKALYRQADAKLAKTEANLTNKTK